VSYKLANTRREVFEIRYESIIDN